MLDRLGSRTQPWLDLYHAHTGETFTGWFHDGERYLAGALRDLEVFLADWRDGVAVTMCLRLYWALARVSTEAWAGGVGRSITVLSGYRTPRTNAMLPGAAANSFHMYGRAVDFRIDGWAVSKIADRLELLEVGGVGRYDGFVHVDSGPPRRWHA